MNIYHFYKIPHSQRQSKIEMLYFSEYDDNIDQMEFEQ